MDERNKLKLKITVGRSNLLFFAILTGVNIILILLNSSMYLPYSSFICINLLALSRTLADELGIAGIYIAGIVIVVLLVGFLILCYTKSKKNHKWFIAAAVYLAIDTAAMLFLAVNSGEFGYFLLDTVMHALLIYYFVNALRAYSKFNKLPAYDEATDGIDFSADANFGDESESGQIADETEDSADESEPDEVETVRENELKLYNNDGKQVLIGRYKSYNAIVAKKGEQLLLVVNGYICDEADCEPDSVNKLSAIVNGVEFYVNCRTVGIEPTDIYLLADGMEIARR